MRINKAPYLLSLMLILLTFVASAGGLLIEGLYRDTELIKRSWLGNDLVTLLVVVPAFIFSLALSYKGSTRAYLVWMGLLAYTIYNYAFYLFGAVFNKFFLIYVAIFSLSIYALVLGLSDLDLKRISQYFSIKTPVRWISAFLLFVSLPLAIVEIGMIINFLITDKVPEAPSLIFALDLSVVVTNTALAAVLLWQKKSWGYVLSAIMLVKAFTYGLVLSTATAIVANTGSMDPLMPFYVLITVGGLIFLIILLKNLNTIHQ